MSNVIEGRWYAAFLIDEDGREMEPIFVQALEGRLFGESDGEEYTDGHFDRLVLQA